MEYILQMTFLTEKGLKSNFSINGAKADITPDQVNNLMDLIIQKNIFLSSSGALVKKAGAQITERKVQKITMA